jgi:H+-transporting ATPase
VAFVLVCLILAIALTRGDSLTTTLQFVLVLTVAAIPVAMPTVLSVTMAVGARLLAGKGAIVSRLASIEELAGMSVLCSDKTGTLTQNTLTLGEPYCAKGVDPETVVLFAALASRKGNRDTIDDTVTAAVGDARLLASYRVTGFVPFDPVRKRTEAAVAGPENRPFRVTKGAPQVILDLVEDETGSRAGAEQAIAGFASRGFRALAVARTDGEDIWRLLGVLPMSDPPRPDSRSTIEAARRMNITVKMVTGDQLPIGKEIASQLGMGTGLLDARTLGEPGEVDRGDLDERIEKADGFAQVYPEHKYRIVEALQRRGHITGMTGDGVNDAPALKKADVGIAVSGATDAARAAAAIVLLTPGLSVIIEAIRESRKIFRRMTGYATYRIAETIRVLLFMTFSIIVFNFYPVTAVMIVLLALLNDGAILSIAYDRAGFSEGPEAWDMRNVLSIATVLGVLGVVASFGIFYLGERVFGLDRGMIQTLIYLKLSVAGHLTIFLTRVRGHF